MNCYFCGEKCIGVGPYDVCRNHAMPVYHYENDGVLRMVSFAIEYNDVEYSILYSFVLPYTKINIRFESIFYSNEILDLTPENILKKLPTILTFS
jgi:hypothetical protein